MCSVSVYYILFDMLIFVAGSVFLSATEGYEVLCLYILSGLASYQQTAQIFRTSPLAKSYTVLSSTLIKRS
jgi:hypothetical protein